MSPIPKTPTDTTLESIQQPIPVVQTLTHEPIQPKFSSPLPFPKPKTKSSITPDHLLLVEEIEQVTGDTWSRGHFFNLVRQTNEQTVYAALSVTREKMAMESGVNAGAYFTATLNGMKGLAGLGEISPRASIHKHYCPDYLTTPPPDRPAPRLLRLDET